MAESFSEQSCLRYLQGLNNLTGSVLGITVQDATKSLFADLTKEKYGTDTLMALKLHKVTGVADLGYMDRYTNNRVSYQSYAVSVVYINRNINVFFQSPDWASRENIFDKQATMLTEDRYHRIKITQPRDGHAIVYTNKISDSFLKKVFLLYPVFLKLTVPEALRDKVVSERLTYNDLLEHYKNNTQRFREDPDVELTRILTQFQTSAINTLRREISTVNNNIENYETSLLEQYKRKRDIEQRIFIRQNCANEVQEQVEDFSKFLKISKEVKNVYFRDNKIYIHVVSPLIYTESDAIERALKAKSSLSPSASNPLYHAFKECFVNQTHRIYTQCVLVIEPQSNSVYAAESRGYHDTFNIDREFPEQPHLSYHSCFGGYKLQINKHMALGDFTGVLSVALAATKNLNILDGIVSDEFIRDLRERYYDAAIIENCETGEFTSIRRLTEEVKEREANQANRRNDEEDDGGIF